MCPSPDELSQNNDVAAPSANAEPSPVNAAEPVVAKPATPSATASTAKSWRPPALVYTGFSLMTIMFVVWILFSWSGYSDKYAQVTEGWSLGNTKMLEITIVKDDKDGLACSSDLNFDGVRCGYAANGTQLGPNVVDSSKVLQPYNTVKNELFIAAGLWTSKGLPNPLPAERFTVVCNYRVVGVSKNMSLRWGTKAVFDPLKHSVAIGTLSDCVIPQ